MNKQTARLLDVQSALNARKTAHKLRKMGFEEHAKQAWHLVRLHLKKKQNHGNA